MSSNVIGTILLKVQTGQIQKLTPLELKLYNEYQKSELETSIFNHSSLKGQGQSGEAEDVLGTKSANGTGDGSQTSAAGKQEETAKPPVEPKTTKYVVQVGDKISDLVKKSLSAQGKTNPTPEDYNAAKEKFLKDNEANIKKAKNGTQYLNAGAEVVLDGEIDVSKNKTKADVEAEYRAKYPPANKSGAPAAGAAGTSTKPESETPPAAKKKDDKGTKISTQYEQDGTLVEIIDNKDGTATIVKYPVAGEIRVNKNDGKAVPGGQEASKGLVIKKVQYKNYDKTTQTGTLYIQDVQDGKNIVWKNKQVNGKVIEKCKYELDSEGGYSKSTTFSSLNSAGKYNKAVTRGKNSEFIKSFDFVYTEEGSIKKTVEKDANGTITYRDGNSKVITKAQYDAIK